MRDAIDAIHASAADIEALQRLPMLVVRAGYSDVYLLYGALHMRRDALRREISAAPPALRVLVQLFALGDAVETASLSPLFTESDLAALIRLGVLLPRDNTVQTGGLTLMPILGRLAFVPTPPQNPMAFFGDDVAGLLARICPPPGARALNLHAGSGVAALLAAERCSQLIAVERSQLARACAELNVVMNGLGGRIEVMDEALFNERHLETRFDYVIANTPLLPFPQRLFAPPGQALSDEGAYSPTTILLRALPKLLSPSGHAQLVGADLGDGGGPAIVKLLETAALENGLSLVMTIPCKSELPPDSRVLEALAWACHSVSGLSPENARDRLLVHLDESGYHTLYLFYVTASFNPAHPGLSIGRFDQWGKGFWFR